MLGIQAYISVIYHLQGCFVNAPAQFTLAEQVTPTQTTFSDFSDPALQAIVTPSDWVSVAFSFPKILSLPRGKGETVVLVSELSSTCASFQQLAKFLRYLGYTVFIYTLPNRADVAAVNMSNIQQKFYRTCERVDALTLIGLGEALGCFFSISAPTNVKQMITLGTCVKEPIRDNAYDQHIIIEPTEYSLGINTQVWERVACLIAQASK